MSEEYEAQLSWEETEGARKCVQHMCVCVCVVCDGERERENGEKVSYRETGGDWFHLHHSV